MSKVSTQDELLNYLDETTKHAAEMPDLSSLTTIEISEQLGISRNLTSQYLNELVQNKLAVKINSRPVIFLHKRDVELFLQHSLTETNFQSIAAMFENAGMHIRHNFEKAIGYDQSLNSCIVQLKAGLEYPPAGLPILLCGSRGTGKSLLAKLAFEYGEDKELFPTAAQFKKIDCSLFENNNSKFLEILFGKDSASGAINEVHGGVVVLSRFEMLAPIFREAVESYIGMRDGFRRSEKHDILPARIIFTVDANQHSIIDDHISRCAPIVIDIPSLQDRAPSERGALVMHFLQVEGRRMSKNISISRGALKVLVKSDFSDNIDGLKTCITNSCASTYLSHTEERLIINTIDLPSNVLSSVTFDPSDDDSQLVKCEGFSEDFFNQSSVVGMVQQILGACISASIEKNEAINSSAVSALRAFQDYVSFGAAQNNSRMKAYEHVLNPIFESVGDAFGIELTKKSSRILAQLLCIQQWRDSTFEKWEFENAKRIHSVIESLDGISHVSFLILEELAGQVYETLGYRLSEIVKIILFLNIKEAYEASVGRECVGIILCHGYSTATSIADAANRILKTRIYDAIDMNYDQQFQDIRDQLTHLLSRYSYCESIVLLVDTGSLAGVGEVVKGIVHPNVYVVDNVSTGLALEIGSSIQNNHGLKKSLEECSLSCKPHYSVYSHTDINDAVLFCSENGLEAAEGIRDFIKDSFPIREVKIKLVVSDFHILERDGHSAQVFNQYNVRAIVGTISPNVTGIPFVSLDEILYGGAGEKLESAFSDEFDTSMIEKFRVNIRKNFTLRNIIGSITILNPDTLYSEIERAITKFEELSNSSVDSRISVVLYAHIAALVERLVTKTPVNLYPNIDDFKEKQKIFISEFKKSFSPLERCYRVIIPESEIAYIYDIINGSFDVSKRNKSLGAVLTDE
jgi:sigma-54 dependent transcriptional regulator of gfr operon